ncbi:MAG: cyclic nucleotide-binding domain-containing protein [Candidatus Niyogibacteria bacterium]|nr:cyclic nucleotide-binding domain-containing protein [Candidatus Niyogibacteria bacterium]
MTPMIFKPGNVLFNEGDPSPCMYYIVSGNVKVVRGNVELAIIGADDFVGEMGFLRTKPRSASVCVSTESKIEVRALCITNDNWNDVVQEHPNIGLMLAAKLADRLEKADERIVQQEQELKDAKDLIADNEPHELHEDGCECQSCVQGDTDN